MEVQNQRIKILTLTLTLTLIGGPESENKDPKLSEYENAQAMDNLALDLYYVEGDLTSQIGLSLEI